MPARNPIPTLGTSFRNSFTAPAGPQGFGRQKTDLTQRVTHTELQGPLRNGDVVIAAITSCTNTSNPSVMIGAGLVAKKAVERGLTVADHVKTSLAPGSRVVTEYLQNANLMPYLAQLGFDLVGYGCTTCIGNSGPLPEAVSHTVQKGNLVVAGVLSGNRNFEGRIHALVQANYLASPPLVVAYALAGTVDIDLTREPLGKDSAGKNVHLQDIWPSTEEIAAAIESSITPELFLNEYEGIETSNETWNAIEIPSGSQYNWNSASTYVQEPPFFVDLTREVSTVPPITNARVLAKLGDSTTTDHISPAGAIPQESPAGIYLNRHDVLPRDFNSFGARRGNHEVMMRGTFANIRIKNKLVPDTEGGITKCFADDAEIMPIYDAAMRYQEEGIPLIVLGGKDYGMGSSRDWAAKGTLLLGVKAVIVESFERIHRSNLIGMGVLPLEFVEGQTAETIGLDGTETYSLNIPEKASTIVDVLAVRTDGTEILFPTQSRLDTPVEVEYYRNGGILHYVLREFLADE